LQVECAKLFFPPFFDSRLMMIDVSIGCKVLIEVNWEHLLCVMLVWVSDMVDFEYGM